jgi:hypothetical protein
MKVTVDIDLNEIAEEGFEGAVADAIVRRLTTQFAAKAEAFVTNKIDKLITSSVEVAVDKKLHNLLDEPVVISDRWGSKKFLGSVEDYIKQEIDDKLLKPVDSRGQKVSGCTSDTTTWIEWTVNKLTKDAMDALVEKTRNDSLKHFNVIATTEMRRVTDEAATQALSNVIGKALSGK